MSVADCFVFGGGCVNADICTRYRCVRQFYLRERAKLEQTAAALDGLARANAGQPAKIDIRSGPEDF